MINDFQGVTRIETDRRAEGAGDFNGRCSGIRSHLKGTVLGRHQWHNVSVHTKLLQNRRNRLNTETVTNTYSIVIS
jgi:hypothetical protein